MRVVPDAEKLSAYGLSPMAIVGHLQATNVSVQAGNFSDNNQEVPCRRRAISSTAARI